MKQGEYIALTCFVSVVVLWVTRDPSEEVNGWKNAFPEPDWMTDGMSVVFIAIFLFVLPIDQSGLFSIFNCFKSEENKVSMSKSKIPLFGRRKITIMVSPTWFKIGL